MGRTNQGWKVGRWLLLSILPTLHLSAQVGHEPSHSPYHDIRRGGVGVITVGYLGGSRGGPGVGISDGPTGGLRYEVAFGNALGASLGIAYAQTTRFVVDPTKDSLSRRTGPFNTRSEEHTSELQSQSNLVCRLLLVKKKTY